MKILITFDYELFFGGNSGSPEKCIIEPVDAIIATAREYGAPMGFFVDAGYLHAIRRFMAASATLGKHDALIRRNLDAIAAQKHEILLHVHPHWEDTIWAEERWQSDLSRFCLSDFDPPQVLDIVGRYAKELRCHVADGRLLAYRAGGWAVQPFPAIGAGLAAEGIFIDSTIFAGGRDTLGIVNFDFTRAPSKSRWRFETDPATEDPGGRFLEVPTSSMTVSPSYYRRLALSRLTTSSDRRPFGDGAVRSLPPMRRHLDKLGKLLTSTRYCVTLDGMKASLVAAEYRRMRKEGAEFLVLLSHPKAMTPFSIECMRELMDEIYANGDEVVGYGYFNSVI